ncbi:putative Sir2-like protein [Salmonella phage gmork]|uniref:Putative Sir2-like protein n=1 Tax=Salmonella phage gmork TaxID=2713300 RepID=A0A6G8RIF7_9CAUD|nr:putative Sir2-like protein [Salmonella phage gmork]
MRRLIVVSGAGLSVDSGVRAFRTDTASGKSLWDEYDLEEVCSLPNFEAGFRRFCGEDDPNYFSARFPGIDEDGNDLYLKTHEFYNMRRQELQTVKPNIAHLRIAEWFQRYGADSVKNFTTNVDDLLERAGIPRDEIIHAHGYLKEVIYRQGRNQIIEDVGYTAIAPEDYEWVKPNVTFFGETAPWYMGQINLFDTLTSNDMVIVVGCSNQVIDFNWELFPAVCRGTKMMVVNPQVRYDEQLEYEKRGVTVWRAGAAEVFGNKHFIDQVEAFMEGNIYVPEKHV